jgi:hypothetical protein
MKTQTRKLSALALLAITLLSGCGQRHLGSWTGPSAPAPLTESPWSFGESRGRIIRSRHYELHTTIEDEAFAATLAQVLEGAHRQYQMLTPSVPETREPMKCYVFNRRAEWAAFTSQQTGPASAVYLQITRGGYTIRDWFVAYYIGQAATCSVTAHEGWHQYVSRHFKGRLPPFLEEGTACLFEDVRFVNKLPRWDLSINPTRAHNLRKTIDRNKLYPLEKLIMMHAGDIVNLPGDRIEAFYSQNWAFARFLWDGEGGGYREAFRKLVDDTAKGTVFIPPGAPPAVGGQWAPATVKPILEHYLGADLKTIDEKFKAYMHNVAFKQLSKQLQASP